VTGRATRDMGKLGEDEARRPAAERSDELWDARVEQLFAAALEELRRRTQKALSEAEQRRFADVTELSAAITKQHDIIDSLKRELLDARQAEEKRVLEARQAWQEAEAERMRAAREAWQSERAELTRELDRHRSVAEQLADQLAAAKAQGESKERQFWERLREITAEVDRCLVKARAEWEREVTQMTATDWQLPSFLSKPDSPADPE
jgi:chromosome segregation ATPase